MRKSCFYVGALTFALAFSACQKEVIVVSEGGSEVTVPGIGEGDQVLMLSAADGDSNSGRSRSKLEPIVPGTNPGIGDPNATNSTGRPLFSSEAKQDIQHVRLFFVRKAKAGAAAKDDSKVGKIALVKEVNHLEWSESVKYKNGRQLLITLKKENNETLTSDYDYDVYAVGYSQDKENFTYEGYDFNTALVKDAVFTEDAFYAKMSTRAYGDAEEIFAGKISVGVTSENKLQVLDDVQGTETPNLYLYRQVAGISGYFTNIPVKVGEHTPTHLRLVARDKNNKLVFGMLDTNVGENSDSPVTNYVINAVKDGFADGTVSFWGEDDKNRGYVVYEMDLNNWFPQGFDKSDLNGDGYVGYEDVKKYLTDNSSSVGQDYSGFWKNPNVKVNGHVQGLVRGSVWGGKFVMPFKLKSGLYTLQLQLVEHVKTEHSTQTNILKHWNITVDKANLNGAAQSSSTGVVTADEKDESIYVYNIYRNHMYSIGKKKWDNGTGPTDPTDPTEPVDPTDPTDPTGPTDPDKPTDLSKGQDLVINVNSMWEADHDMGLD